MHVRLYRPAVVIAGFSNTTTRIQTNIFLHVKDRKMVLKHHPDKNKSKKTESQLNAVQECFTCITTAGDILMNKAKRRAYDSIDPTFDNYVPPVNANSKINFYQVFTPVFQSNAR